MLVNLEASSEYLTSSPSSEKFLISNTHSFLGISSSLKANQSIRVVNYSNRFILENMNGTFSSDIIAVNEGINGTDGPSRMFYCNNGTAEKLCLSSIALAGLSLSTPTPVQGAYSTAFGTFTVGGSTVTVPTSIYTRSPTASPSIHRLPYILGLIGGTSILAALVGAIFCMRSNRRKGRALSQHPAMKWLNKTSGPPFEAAELSAHDGPYDIAELPGQDGTPIFELSAGSIKRGSEGNEVQVIENASPSGEETTEPKVVRTAEAAGLVGLGIDTITSSNADDRTLRIRTSQRIEAQEESSPQESTTMLSNTSPNVAASRSSYPPQRSCPLIPEEITTMQSSKREIPQLPAVRESVPMMSDDEFRALAGVFAPSTPPRLSSQQAKWQYR